MAGLLYITIRACLPLNTTSGHLLFSTPTSYFASCLFFFNFNCSSYFLQVKSCDMFKSLN